MSKANVSLRLDTRYTQMGDLAAGLRHLLKRIIQPLGAGMALAVAFGFLDSRFGAVGLGLICAGTYAALAVWSGSGIGLPLLPMLVAQHLILYGLPILVNEKTIRAYPEAFVTDAGLEVFVFLIALTASWKFGMQVFRPSAPFCYGFEELKKGGSSKLVRLGFGLAAAATAYVPFERLGLLDLVLQMLPGGSSSIVNALVSAIAMCGFFMLSLIIGAGQMNPTGKTMFWLIVAFNCYVTASAFLLSAVATLVFSVAAGLFWSSGKVPWRFLVIVGSILAFLNLGKIEMRTRYWTVNGANEIPEFSLSEMPAHYAEWIGVSFDLMLGDQARDSGRPGGPVPENPAEPGAKGQSLLSRVNNLQNLLFVMDAEKNGHIPPLGGSTYTLIPPLLIPRIMWPGEKPRSHEGQVRLNVHFGRQDLESTLTAYIAWGLLPEAYGNFGPIAGAIILGAFLGVCIAWVENFTASKLVVSLEGFGAFALFVGLANSYEMVASVLVTSIFQSVVPIVLAMYPFVRRRKVIPPPQEAA